MRMELVNAVINAGVVSMVGLILAWVGKGRIDRVEHRLDLLQASVDSFRSDLTQVALAVGVRGRANQG